MTKEELIAQLEENTDPGDTEIAINTLEGYRPVTTLAGHCIRFKGPFGEMQRKDVITFSAAPAVPTRTPLHPRSRFSET